MQQDILDYWFGDKSDTAAIAKAQQKLWWSKDETVDAEIRTRFQPLLSALEEGLLDDWADTAEGTLALIILSDQFPRNMFRGSPLAFHYDPWALQFCKEAIAKGFEKELSVMQKAFLYMPLEHSENLDDQEAAVAQFSALHEEEPGEETAVLLDFAKQHHAIIQRFGRYPHRNEILGRESTVEELEFLKQPGSSF
ncbi:DUF924 domain-containing protein [Aliidiomarina minuta]|uniref:DUF924 domain-containing protein n=1 Tax=Aliidiomarina minuta TaxID=880057 RepID=A0A432W3J1_9GAMM|nr:DUF924 family protein [Aliidiomarina minuta]RUO23934.1 DUF924 domain-containing protein [Aliidiomarina minuta]